jgi:3-dehydroquinate synthetase
VVDAVLKDKKRDADRIHFVMLEEIGRAVVEEVPIAELKAAAAFEDILQPTGRRGMP